ncbi:MAG: hypothetical protein ACPHVN_00810 [Luminiphilus sp.]
MNNQELANAVEAALEFHAHPNAGYLCVAASLAEEAGYLTPEEVIELGQRIYEHIDGCITLGSYLRHRDDPLANDAERQREFWREWVKELRGEHHGTHV